MQTTPSSLRFGLLCPVCIGAAVVGGGALIATWRGRNQSSVEKTVADTVDLSTTEKKPDSTPGS